MAVVDQQGSAGGEDAVRSRLQGAGAGSERAAVGPAGVPGGGSEGCVGGGGGDGPAEPSGAEPGGAAPGGAAPARPKALRRSPILLELAAIAFLGWIYDWLQDLAPLREATAFRNGRDILDFERQLSLAPEQALNRWLVHHNTLAYISSDFYDNAIFAFTFALAAWIWWRRPDIYRPLRNDLVLANLIGFAVFWAFPVAPPRMLKGFVDVVEKTGGLGSWHNMLISHADQLAAMPSMHLAWAVWCSLVLWRLASPGLWRAAALVAGVAYPLATAWVVMATANHYLADVVAGTLCLVVSVLVVEVAIPARPGGRGGRRGRHRQEASAVLAG